jgi:hypothetical protein
VFRWSQVERSVWTLLVEVADVDAEDVLELAATKDQAPVEALLPVDRWSARPPVRVRAAAGDLEWKR